MFALTLRPRTRTRDPVWSNGHGTLKVGPKIHDPQSLEWSLGYGIPKRSQELKIDQVGPGP